MARPCFRGAAALTLLLPPALALAQKPETPNLTDRIAALEAVVASLQGSVADLQKTLANQQALIETLQGTVDGMDSRLVSVENSEAMKLNQYLEVTTDAYLNLTLIRFSGINVQLVNGVGSEPFLDELYYPTVNGKGNLILGYNQVLEFDLPSRAGSHNLVIGPLHEYSGAGGFVAGFYNSLNGVYSSVSGGAQNTASGPYSSVSGGWFNTASGWFSSVSGGSLNNASFHNSSVSGGLRIWQAT